jgi:tight adherence protein B
MAPTVITPRRDFADILRETESFAVPEDESFGNQLNGWFDNLMVQSGTGLSPSMVSALCLCSAVTLGGLIFVIQENLLTTAIGMFLGFLVPIIVTMLVRARRQSLLSQQLPAMIDELARAARTGRSLENCLAFVASDTPNPLGGELRNCMRKLALGLRIDEALQDLPRRTGLVATSVLATALTVHQQSGGDLVRVLDRLSRTLRDRLQFQGRLRAATAASRATAILMIILPPAILAFFIFRDPNYLTNLFDTTWGARMTVVAFVLEFLGAIWTMRVLRSSQQL